MSEKHYSKWDHHPEFPKSNIPSKATTISQTPKAISDCFYSKIPIVLAEATVQIDLDSTIKFPEPVLEIKKIKKNLKLTQCRLLLPTNKLFIKGFVRKNIQYAAPTKSNPHWIQSTIKSLTVDIPFNIVTEVDFIHEPEFQASPSAEEFSYFSSQPLPDGFASKDKLLSSDFSEFNQISGEVYNELPYCELISSHFIEYDEFLNRKMGEVYNYDHCKLDAPFEEGTFDKMEEKMVIELTLKVLQKQQVKTGEHYHNKTDCDEI